MSTSNDIKMIMKRTLQLDERIEGMDHDSALLGAIPELDSMAVVTLITNMEEHFGITVYDDEISADTFATLGSLTDFVEGKL